MEIWGEENAGSEGGMVFLFLQKASHRPGWPWIPYAAEVDLELLSLLTPPEHWDYNHVLAVYMALRIEPRGLVHTRQALNQVSYIPSPGGFGNVCGP